MAALTCETCADTGWQPVAHRGQPAVVRCACWKATHRSRVIGIPRDLAEATLGNYLRRKGTEAALRMAARWPSGSMDAYLGGPVGCGKTRLACSLANEVANRDHNQTAMCLDVVVFLDDQRTFATSPDDALVRLSPMALATQADLLILDDVGSLEKVSDFTVRTLLTLYNARVRAQKRTLWTSNKTLDELSALLHDDRLTSRIAGAGPVVWMTADDFRVSGPKTWAAEGRVHG